MPEPFLRDPVVLTPEQALARLPEASGQVGPGQAPETLVLVHATPLLDLLVDALEAEPGEAKLGPATMYASQDYEGVGLCQPGTGAPAAALVLERAIAGGTRRVLSLGFGAGLEPHAGMGDLCLVTGALAYDGVTSHYAGPGYEPEPDGGLTRTLAEALEGGKQGKVWTTAAPYRETLAQLERHREQGVLAVDMETSAVLTVAAYRGVPASAMVVTTDVIRGDDWVPMEDGTADGAVRTAARGLVSVLKGLRNLQR